jgi:lipoic acid synthetase
MCPNIAECWGKHRTATFMILGDVCTRACGFCAVTSGRPTEYDLLEPSRVAAAIADLKLRHAVITSVDRDDLADGGASIFAETVRQIRKRDPQVKIELLTPDFQGSLASVKTIIDAGPDIFSHNIETVRRLYPTIRFKSDYTTSFGLLKAAKAMAPSAFVKTGIMVGLGEEKSEIQQLLQDAVEAGVDILTIGQYLRPSVKHAEIKKYYHPDEFAELREIGRSLGLRWVFSGPLVRSSYHAEDVFEQMLAR